MFISILYVFRAAMCSSSGEFNVSMRDMVDDLHTRRSSTQSDIYQVSHWYN